MQSSKLLTLALALCLSRTAYGQLDWASVTNPTVLQSGDGTFYGLGQDAQGTCSYSANFANTNDLPWSTGTSLTVAMNDAQFDDSAACGMCVQLRGTGAGLGTTPIPSTWTMALVNNRCPECAHGSIDLAASGDGRWNIQWYAVPCNVGSTPLYYSVVVSSYYWFSMVVSNTRVPITGVSVKIGGTWVSLKRSNNNQWAYYNSNGPWQSSFPMGVQVTSITGQTVSDVITGPSGNSGAVQFSADGSGSTAASTVPATTSTTASPPVGSAYPPVSISPPSPPLAATPPVAAVVPPPVAAVSAPPPFAATPPVVAQTPPAAPPANLPEGSFYIQNYQQCGGTGMMCNNKPYTSAPCQDATWSAAVCQSSDFACTRGTAEIWSCLPGSGTPSPPVASPPVGASATPPTTSSTPPTPATTSSASPPPSPTTTTAPQPPAGINVVPPPTPTATTSASQLTPPPPQQTPPTPTTTTASPPTGTIATSSIAASTPTTTNAPRALSIAAGGQCGGTSQCEPAGEATDKVTCNNGPWTGATCPSGYSCTANPGPLVWTCMGAETASSSSPPVAGRRLLEAR